MVGRGGGADRGNCLFPVSEKGECRCPESTETGAAAWRLGLYLHLIKGECHTLSGCCKSMRSEYTLELP